MMMVDGANITAVQIRESLLGVLGFVPALVCTGYATAWLTNLHGFRGRSLVERVFWSVPLSLAVTTIGSYLVGRFAGLNAVVALLWTNAAACVALLAWEWRGRRRRGERWVVGLRPLGPTALLLAAAWVAVAVLSRVALQSGQHLSMNVAIWDQSYRVNWTQTVLRTGVPPANSLYWFGHTATMRNYYYWYVVCAAVAKMWGLSVRAVFIAGCVWSGFGLVALLGLFLKHVLDCGARLRRQLLVCVGLLTVTGLDLGVNLWNAIVLHQPMPADLEWWSKDPIDSWYDSLLWAPHHVASMVCCLFAFLLAWKSTGAEPPSPGLRRQALTVALIAAALASAFGLSIYVAFGFFLGMLVWASWQAVAEHALRRAAVMAAGGMGAAVLLVPYLLELRHDSGGTAGGGLFGFAVREMIPAGGLLAWGWFPRIAMAHPVAARNLANLIQLVPGYVFELGFYFFVLCIFLIPAWRGRRALTEAQRSLVVLAVASFPFLSLLRSRVLAYDDYGIRSVLILQCVLLLLASELLMGGGMADQRRGTTVEVPGVSPRTPQWLRVAASLALSLGVLSTFCQALMLRFVLPVAEANMSKHQVPQARAISHNAYISHVGYAQMDRAVPKDAVVQFNPKVPNPFWTDVDLVGVNRQVAIAGDTDGCGSMAGGDPSGCAAMAAAVDGLYKGATAEQARAVCGEYGIGYLVARVYDAAWKDGAGWVWTLRPVVQDAEFRVLDCGR